MVHKLAADADVGPALFATKNRVYNTRNSNTVEGNQMSDGDETAGCAYMIGIIR